MVHNENKTQKSNCITLDYISSFNVCCYKEISISKLRIIADLDGYFKNRVARKINVIFNFLNLAANWNYCCHFLFVVLFL